VLRTSSAISSYTTRGHGIIVKYNRSYKCQKNLHDNYLTKHCSHKCSVIQLSALSSSFPKPIGSCSSWEAVYCANCSFGWLTSAHNHCRSVGQCAVNTVEYIFTFFRRYSKFGETIVLDISWKSFEKKIRAINLHHFAKSNFFQIAHFILHCLRVWSNLWTELAINQLSSYKRSRV
jgi:hypothetical protein